MKFYRIVTDFDFKGGWSLGDLTGNPDIWRYATSGEIINPPQNLTVSIIEKGKPLDMTFITQIATLIVSEKVARFFSPEEVQLIPVKIDNWKSSMQYYIVKITKEFECVDEDRSEFNKFLPNDRIRPDRAGDFRGFFKLVINPDCINNSSIFRIKRFFQGIIVSQQLKNNLEFVGNMDIKFSDVTPQIS